MKICVFTDLLSNDTCRIQFHVKTDDGTECQQRNIAELKHFNNYQEPVTTQLMSNCVIFNVDLNFIISFDLSYMEPLAVKVAQDSKCYNDITQLIKDYDLEDDVDHHQDIDEFTDVSITPNDEFNKLIDILCRFFNEKEHTFMLRYNDVMPSLSSSIFHLLRDRGLNLVMQ